MIAARHRLFCLVYQATEMNTQNSMTLIWLLELNQLWVCSGGVILMQSRKGSQYEIKSQQQGSYYWEQLCMATGTSVRALSQCSCYKVYVRTRDHLWYFAWSSS